MTSDVNLSSLSYVLREGREGVEEIAVGYGELLEVSIDFMIIAMTIFVVIKAMNKLKTQAEDPKDKKVATPKDIELLSNIEKLMEEQNALLKAKTLS
jgi:large conductance mechanosensitive channel